ncbi:DUF4140 domain-containing protein [Comamonas sp. JC664]|uniref:DUF4140 domain-containing protein n=1 Tax=Comamonas sp. JC664 TaxID=2801917 RepID=UPI00174CA4C9|nr:DUF4140 domain-containing protein [Comamonas sp. JC664]MBL0692218.1 DUF4140 domain-containing protein [Comamonas sp. JC664]GHG98059.1 hypothetical protein GCM10012319_63270 [Comamonas sp. KCTC 72670]
MHILGLGLMAASVMGATLEAPITSVTVYSDQAQVVRAGSVTVSGSQRVTFPRLPKNVDTDSIRVEADGAEVSHVDVRTVTREAFSHDDARKLIARTEEVDISLARIIAERNVHHAQIEALRRIRPKVPDESEAAWAQTNPSGWSTAASFLVDVKVALEPVTTGGYALQSDDGIATWKVKLAPGEKRTVDFAFHVDAPSSYETKGL